MMTPEDDPSTSGLMVAAGASKVSILDRAPDVALGEAHDAGAAPGANVVQRTGALSWRAVIAQSGVIWLMTRLAYSAYTYYALVTRYQTQINRGRLSIVSVPLNVFVTSWGAAADATWYGDIARWGYWQPQAAPYFPLYPLLIKAVSFLVGSHILVAGLLVANAGSLGAFIALALLVAHERGRLGATAPGTATSITRALLAFAAYPLAFLLVAAYSDGVALAFIFAALLCARRGEWRWAALWAVLAGLTQPIALALVAPLAWEYGRQRGWFARRLTPPEPTAATIAPVARTGARPFVGFVAVMAAPLGMAFYLMYLGFRFGDPLVAFSVGAAGATNGFLAPAGSFAQGRAVVDLTLVGGFLLLTLVSSRRAPLSFTLYMVGLLAACLSTGVVTGADPALNAARYLLAAAPIFLGIGQWTERRPWFNLLIVGGGFMLQAICALLFLWGGWSV